MIVARLDARRVTEYCRHEWMNAPWLTGRSTGYVLCGWTCFLEELTRDFLPRAVSTGVSQIVYRSGQRQIWVSEL